MEENLGRVELSSRVQQDRGKVYPKKMKYPIEKYKEAKEWNRKQTLTMTLPDAVKSTTKDDFVNDVYSSEPYVL